MKKQLFIIITSTLIFAMSCNKQLRPQSVCGIVPNGSSKSLLRLIRINVNPSHKTGMSESFFFKNFGESEIGFKGWTIKSNNNYVWYLDEIQGLKPCDSITNFSVPYDELNNDKGWIQLISPDKVLVQTIQWNAPKPGEYVYPDY